MSVLLLALLAAAVLSTTFVEFGYSGAVVPLKDFIKEKKIVDLKRLASRIYEDSRRSMLKFKETLRGRMDVMKQNLALSTQQKRELKKRLNKLKRKSVDKVQPMGDSIEEINMKSGATKALFQGDMILSSAQQKQVAEDIGLSRSKRQAYNVKNYPAIRWPDGVAYLFDPELSENEQALTAFRKAAQLWMDDTCIDFSELKEQNNEYEYVDGEGYGTGKQEVQREETYEDYASANEDQKEGGGKPMGEEQPLASLIYVFPKRGCWSPVGRQPLLNILSLGQGCETIGTAVHEIGHALGFWHTHSRHDRDQYITVDYDNIDKTELRSGNFNKESENTNYNYNLTYDYGSVMHYAATSASINKRPTMVPNDIMYTETLGSETIAFYDLLMMNMFYDCTDICKDEPTPCQNGGFAHPRNCSKCICPSGYGGQFCDERPPGCGESLEANIEWTPLEDKLDGEEAYEERDGFKRCNYWIKAPAGKKVEVKIVELPTNVTVNGCVYAGVEIKTHPDQRRTGYRFCSKANSNTVLTSNSSLVPVITYNRQNRTTVTKLEYRYV